MGIYYNRELVAQVPTLWSTFPDILKKPEPTSDASAGSVSDNTATKTTLRTQPPIAEIPAFTNM